MDIPILMVVALTMVAMVAMVTTILMEVVPTTVLMGVMDIVTLMGAVRSMAHPKKVPMEVLRIQMRVPL